MPVVLESRRLGSVKMLGGRLYPKSCEIFRQHWIPRVSYVIVVQQIIITVLILLKICKGGRLGVLSWRPMVVYIIQIIFDLLTGVTHIQFWGWGRYTRRGGCKFLQLGVGYMED